MPLQHRHESLVLPLRTKARPARRRPTSERTVHAVRAVQAGNKSLLSYDNSRGVPGYTGFIPQSSCVPVDVKGSVRAAGKCACSVPCSS